LIVKYENIKEKKIPYKIVMLNSELLKFKSFKLKKAAPLKAGIDK
jgi:hypothetical protein